MRSLSRWWNDLSFLHWHISQITGLTQSFLGLASTWCRPCHSSFIRCENLPAPWSTSTVQTTLSWSSKSILAKTGLVISFLYYYIGKKLFPLCWIIVFFICSDPFYISPLLISSYWSALTGQSFASNGHRLNIRHIWVEIILGLLHLLHTTVRSLYISDQSSQCLIRALGLRQEIRVCVILVSGLLLFHHKRRARLTIHGLY